jgi:hypothetical protein
MLLVKAPTSSRVYRRTEKKLVTPRPRRTSRHRKRLPAATAVPSRTTVAFGSLVAVSHVLPAKILPALHPDECICNRICQAVSLINHPRVFHGEAIIALQAVSTSVMFQDM